MNTPEDTSEEGKQALKWSVRFMLSIPFLFLWWFVDARQILAPAAMLVFAAVSVLLSLIALWRIVGLPGLKKRKMGAVACLVAGLALIAFMLIRASIRFDQAWREMFPRIRIALIIQSQSR